ncbi:THAP domain containing 12a [Gadus chalcogrammus]|uniref:THAP domain containing 12a n=1 Tax=Gadus chalcogrammus TaxID=1042646 RepID=UPI0024C3DA51|nr:THAP domain containing 12a [Gadus chalcogrammus]
MQYFCAAPNCATKKSNQHPLFRFPKDAERCKQWVDKCNHEDLNDKSPEQLYRYYRLCVKHFDPSSYESNATEYLSTVLKDDAIPSIFDVPSQPNSTQLKRNKAMAEIAERDIQMRKKVKKSQTETTTDPPEPSEEEGYKEYLKALFELLVLLGEQNIPVGGSLDTKEESMTSSNFVELLDYRMNAGEEALKKRWAEDKDGNLPTRLTELIDVCEKCVRSELLEEVGQNGFFSLITDEVVVISDEWHLPVFLRYVDKKNSQQETFLGFLNFEDEGDSVAGKLLSELTEKWGVKMEQCRAQSHSCSATHFSQVKDVVAKLKEQYPKAVITPRSTCPLNISLANTLGLTGVQLVMSTFKKIHSFFTDSTALQLELENAIAIFYPYKEEKANELKELCHTAWTTSGEAFEVAVDIIESLLLCVDSVHDNEDMRWNDQVIQDALEISKALADFEFIMSLVVLKSTLSLTRAFGANLQGSAEEAHFAADNFESVLQSVLEVAANIDVYHEFWYDEAVNLANAMEVPIRAPRCFTKRQGLAPGVTVLPDHYYKEHVSAPVLRHVVDELKELFGDEHLKALGSQSLIPGLRSKKAGEETEEGNLQMYKDDIPNAGTLSAELHCWWVKWKGPRGKGEALPESLGETLGLADLKFFPNVLAVLRLLGILPTLPLEEDCGLAYRRYRRYIKNTPDHCRSKSLALLNVNIDVNHDLDAMVQAYMKAYPEKKEKEKNKEPEKSTEPETEKL